MLDFSLELIKCLTKHYNIKTDDAAVIVEDEWEYIEQEYLNEASSVESIAKELINIYMVA